MSDLLQCWKCGASLPELSLDRVRNPLPRSATCGGCNADLHVCVMCEYYDTGVAKACRERIADEVGDKRRANFCGYLKLKPGAFQAGDQAAVEKAKAELAALFGETPAGQPAGSESGLTAAELAKRQLDDLFKS